MSRWPHRLVAQDTGFSVQVHGFKSRWGHLIRGVEFFRHPEAVLRWPTSQGTTLPNHLLPDGSDSDGSHFVSIFFFCKSLPL